MSESRETIIKYQEFSYEELANSDQLLVKAAEAAQQKAHAPYSQFKVGCGVSLISKEIYLGNNQENAAYPNGLCAERVALFSIRSKTDEPIDTIAIVANNKDGVSADAFSCGSCRQTMMEYANLQAQPIRLLMRTSQMTYIVLKDVKELLPFYFNSVTLG